MQADPRVCRYRNAVLVSEPNPEPTPSIEPESFETRDQALPTYVGIYTAMAPTAATTNFASGWTNRRPNVLNCRVGLADGARPRYGSLDDGTRHVIGDEPVYDGIGMASCVGRDFE